MTDTSGWDYEGAVLQALQSAETVTDRFEADRFVAVAAVYADLHRTRIMERALAEDVAVSPFVKPEFVVEPEVAEPETPFVGMRYAQDERVVRVLQADSTLRNDQAAEVLEVLNEAGFFVVEVDR